MRMSSSSSDRFRLCMFDLRRGQKEGHEFEKILYFYLPYLSLLIQPFVIGINEWLITSTRLGEQLENLRKELQVRESSQKQLRDELLKVEGNIIRAVSVVKTKENMEVEKSLTDNSPKNFERVNKVLTAKDDEIARLRDELKIISAHWKFKTKELEEYVENHRRIDQDLKKKVLKLEFCLRETRIQTQKLQKMGERNDVAIQ